MGGIRSSASLCAFLVLTACGTYVPGIQEPPGDAVDGQLLVHSIVRNITCEVQDAVNDVIRQDLENVRTGLFKERRTQWLDSWGVQTTLSLAIDEKSGISPVINWLPPSPATAVFNLGAGATVSAGATRTDKLHSYYTVRELLTKGKCNPAARPGGLFLMQSDLKLKEWLFDNTMAEGTGQIVLPSKKDGPFKQDVISHQIKFEVVTSGNVTPGWKLTRLSVNQSGSFFSASRTRTHDLLITFGPAEQFFVIVAGQPQTPAVSQRKMLPSTAASNSHLASEIGLAVANSIKSSTTP
jgi:hypothetical protein